MSFLVVFALFFTSNFTDISAKAEENPGSEILTQEKFLELQKEGIYGLDVTYEMAKEAFDPPEGIEEIIVKKDDIQYGPAQPNDGTTWRAGDIFITAKPGNGIVSWTYGHAGIMGTDGKIVDMISSGVRKIWPYEWFSQNGSISVYRVPNSSVAWNAGNWATNYYSSYRGRVQYSINTDKYSKDKMYCSKLVWQAYWFGTGSAPVLRSPSFAIIHPYGLTTQFNSAYKPYRIY